MCARYKVDPETLPKLGKEMDADIYKRYMFLITGHDPCSVCNGARGSVPDLPERTKSFWTVFANGTYNASRTFVIPPMWTKVRCLDYPIHTVVKLHHLTCLCEHGFYVQECKKCLAKRLPEDSYLRQKEAL